MFDRPRNRGEQARQAGLARRMDDVVPSTNGQRLAWISHLIKEAGVSNKNEPRQGGLRKRLTALAVGVGVGAAMLTAPSSAAAGPGYIPPNGYCWNEWYTISQDYGNVHRPASDSHKFHLTNQTAQPVQWGEQLTINYTYQSTVQKTAGGGFNLDLKVVKIGVEAKYSITTYISLSVSHTTSFNTEVPPYTTKYAEYGAWGRHTAGTYYNLRTECETGDYPYLQTASVDAFNITSVGWRVYV